MYVLFCMSETYEIFSWTKQIQKIWKNRTGGHFTKSLVFWSQEDNMNAQNMNAQNINAKNANV